ncbi:hypothetical protein BGX31_009840, partial [Mortierella sp. GBA43]
MPRHRWTLRERAIKRCQEKVMDIIAGCTEAQTMPTLWDISLIRTILNTIQHLQRTRYIAPRLPMPRSSDIRDRVLDQYQDHHFRDCLRLDHSQFDRLKHMISGSRFFQGHGASQTDVGTQLKVTLYRLGSRAVSVPHVALTFGISRGAVHDFTWRCINAIVELLYFQGEDYLLADAAYPMTSFLVPRYKTPTAAQAKFNCQNRGGLGQ